MQVSSICFNIFSRFFLTLSLMTRLPILYDYNSTHDLLLFSFTLHYYISNIFYILINLVYLFTGVNWRRRRFLLYLYNLLSVSLFTLGHINFLDNQWLRVHFYIYLAFSTSDIMYYFKINKKLRSLWKTIFVSIDDDETRFSDLFPDMHSGRQRRVYFNIPPSEEETTDQDDVKVNE